jgi:hypothetical protein
VCATSDASLYLFNKGEDSLEIRQEMKNTIPIGQYLLIKPFDPILPLPFLSRIDLFASAYY